MTDQTIWRILDAFREGKKVESRSMRSLPMSQPYSSKRYHKTLYTLTSVIAHSLEREVRNKVYVRWFIDGVEVQDE